MSVDTKIRVDLNPAYAGAAERVGLFYPFSRAITMAILEMAPEDRERGIEALRAIREKNFSHGDKIYTQPKVEFSEGVPGGFFRVDFIFNGEQRSLSVCLLSDTLSPNRVSLSLGAWGSSVDIANAVGKKLSCFGDVSIQNMDVNDNVDAFYEYSPVSDEDRQSLFSIEHLTNVMSSKPNNGINSMRLK